jgi:hypothetical protein
MSPIAKKICWTVAQVAVVICAFMIFFTFAPWLGALPISEASPEIASALPSGCPAFTNNHGQHHCFWRGTKEQNPTGFWICAALLFSCWFFLIVTAKKKLGFSFPSFRSLFRHE